MVGCIFFPRRLPHEDVEWRHICGGGFLAAQDHFVVDVTSENGFPSGNLTAIEKGHRNSGFSHTKMVIVHSYVKLPEGTHSYRMYFP